MHSTLISRALLGLALSSVTVTGCAGKSTSASSSPSPSTLATSSAPASTSAEPSASPTAAAVDQTIHITYAGGKVSGAGAVVKVKQNSTVALVVTSDVADEVHLHGYDKMADVTKGGTVTILFKATLPGKWECELEKLKHRLVFLQVQ
jgi:copper(I)-binding protein